MNMFPKHKLYRLFTISLAFGNAGRTLFDIAFIIYATSNRRHLLPEFMHENTPVRKVDVPQYTELHPQEAIEEKRSLSDRFGMWLSFYPMDQQLYLQIVEHYIVKAGLEYNDIVRGESLKWCQARGQRSGRAAYQFSKHWIGSKNLEKLANKDHA